MPLPQEEGIVLINKKNKFYESKRPALFQKQITRRKS